MTPKTDLEKMIEYWDKKWNEEKTVFMGYIGATITGISTNESDRELEGFTIEKNGEKYEIHAKGSWCEEGPSLEVEKIEDQS